MGRKYNLVPERLRRTMRDAYKRNNDGLKGMKRTYRACVGAAALGSFSRHATDLAVLRLHLAPLSFGREEAYRQPGLRGFRPSDRRPCRVPPCIAAEDRVRVRVGCLRSQAARSAR